MMTLNPWQEYAQNFRDNLPAGITYRGDIARYVFNGRRFVHPNDVLWYKTYLEKFGFGDTPAALFAASEPGVWLDPLDAATVISDPATLFSDTEGTTQAQIGDPVALALSKDKGLVLGPELVTNGDFSDGVTGWSPSGNSSRQIVGGDLEITHTGATNGSTQNVSGFKVDATYEVTVTSRRGTGNFWNLRVAQEGTTLGTIYFSGNRTNTDNETIKALIIANAETHSFWLRAGNDPYPNTAYFSNVSVRELPGNHARQPTLASRPVYRADGSARYFEDPGAASLPATVPDLGTDATLAYATEAGVTILTGQTIGAGALEILRGGRTYGLIANNRPWTAAETAGVTKWLSARMPE